MTNFATEPCHYGRLLEDLVTVVVEGKSREQVVEGESREQVVEGESREQVV